jgi:hypothetical protein
VPSPTPSTDITQNRVARGCETVASAKLPLSPLIPRLIDKEVDEMSGVIERAESEWNSPYLMVPKKDGTYRRGKDNVVPDCLSRAVVPVQAQLDQLGVNSGSGDKWIDNLIQKISTNPLKYPNFRVREGHVFKKVKRRDGEADSDWKWVVPKTSRAQLLKRYHDEATTGGHLGVYKTSQNK